jgi:hypothetical protein
MMSTKGPVVNDHPIIDNNAVLGVAADGTPKKTTTDCASG